MHNMSNSKVVVFIDDEANNIRVMKRAFNSRKQWELHTFLLPQDALDMFKAGDLDPELVITDQNMPIKLGYELLKELKTSHPKTFRVLTTANEDIIKKIAEGSEFSNVVNAVLFKPWSRDKIDEVLNNFERHS